MTTWKRFERRTLQIIVPADAEAIHAREMAQSVLEAGRNASHCFEAEVGPSHTAAWAPMWVRSDGIAREATNPSAGD